MIQTVKVIHISEDEYRRLQKLEDEFGKIEYQLETIKQELSKAREVIGQIAALDPCPGQKIANRYLRNGALEKI